MANGGLCNKCTTSIDYKDLAVCDDQGAFKSCKDFFGKDVEGTGAPGKCSPCEDKLCKNCANFYKKCVSC
jgi:hypothetical protein